MPVQVFVRDLKDCDTEQELRLARCQRLYDALDVYALEFEAVKYHKDIHEYVKSNTKAKESIFKSRSFKDSIRLELSIGNWKELMEMLIGGRQNNVME